MYKKNQQHYLSKKRLIWRHTKGKTDILKHAIYIIVFPLIEH